MEQEKPKRRGRAPLVLAVLAGTGLFIAALASSFKLGIATGFAATCGTLLVYHIPAAILGWPRLTLDDVWAFFEAVWDWFAGLFDF